MSNWIFGCRLGLAQKTCARYVKDPRSRGATSDLGGCPSCTHRLPANVETEAVELQYATEYTTSRQEYKEFLDDCLTSAEHSLAFAERQLAMCQEHLETVRGWIAQFEEEETE